MKQISSLVGLLPLLIVGSPYAQTNYPEKQIRIVVGNPPGSQTDTVARLLGQKLAETLRQPIVIDNAAGAGGTIAADRVAKAAPDGYTLGVLTQGQLVINPSLYKLTYDPVKGFALISQLAVTPNMLVVHNAVPAKSVKELVALAKARPGELTYAASGGGGSNHMAAELFKSMAGVDILHVPYKAGVSAITDLLGGRVTMIFSTMVVGVPLMREGKVRALAVTSLKRAPAAPELPTIAESGYPGFEFTNWHGLLAPDKTPTSIVSKLHGETVKALAQPDLRAKLATHSLEGIGNSPDEFAAVIKSEIPKWAKVVKDAGIKPD